MVLQTKVFESLMDCALCEAAAASRSGEVPVGAVMATLQGNEFQIIAAARNEIETKHDATAHAEILAIQRASHKLGNWRLSNAVLCVTLEPCAMCAAAIRFARIPLVVFGATDERMGAFGSYINLSSDTCYGPLPDVISGIKAEQCSTLLKEFFRRQRKVSTASAL